MPEIASRKRAYTAGSLMSGGYGSEKSTSAATPNAEEASEAALCANEQGAYNAMHDMLFGRQDEWAGRDDAGTVFKSYAEQLGLDATKFAQCLDGHQYAAAVQADVDAGSRAGVDGTPAFFVNGYSISGAQPFAIFQGVIESLLAN